MSWGWLNDGIQLIKDIKGIADPIKEFLGKDEKDSGKGFVQPKGFEFPSTPTGTYGYTGLTRTGVSAQKNLTELERLLSPVNRIQNNGYNALANRYVLQAIQTNNIVSNRSLLSDSVGTPDSETISLGSKEI